jgi:hypothetical protein
MYKYNYMPTKTLYVKDADLPLFERAQNELGESLSALMALCLRRQLEAQATGPAQYEYKFVQVPRPPKTLKKAGDLGHEAVVAQHASEGWRLVQIHAPQLPAVPHYFELIFERAAGERAVG